METFENSKLTKEQMNALSSYITARVKSYDPNKGTLASLLLLCVYWWFKELDKGNLHSTYNPRKENSDETVE